jgi:hypothetical protein
MSYLGAAILAEVSEWIVLTRATKRHLNWWRTRAEPHFTAADDCANQKLIVAGNWIGDIESPKPPPHVATVKHTLVRQRVRRKKPTIPGAQAWGHDLDRCAARGDHRDRKRGDIATRRELAQLPDRARPCIGIPWQVICPQKNNPFTLRQRHPTIPRLGDPRIVPGYPPEVRRGGRREPRGRTVG